MLLETLTCCSLDWQVGPLPSVLKSGLSAKSPWNWAILNCKASQQEPVTCLSDIAWQGHCVVIKQEYDLLTPTNILYFIPIVWKYILMSKTPDFFIPQGGPILYERLGVSQSSPVSEALMFVCKLPTLLCPYGQLTNMLNWRIKIKGSG